MLAAFARAARVLAPEGVLDEGVAGSGRRHLAHGDPYRRRSCATRLWNDTTRRLQRRVAGGAAGIDGFAEDYACLAWGLIELFQATAIRRG